MLQNPIEKDPYLTDFFAAFIPYSDFKISYGFRLLCWLLGWLHGTPSPLGVLSVFIIAKLTLVYYLL